MSVNLSIVFVCCVINEPPSKIYYIFFFPVLVPVERDVYYLHQLLQQQKKYKNRIEITTLLAYIFLSAIKIKHFFFKNLKN